MKNQNKNWIYNVEEIFAEQLDYISDRLKLSDEQILLAPSVTEFLHYLTKGITEYFANYNFTDEKIGILLIRYFICKGIKSIFLNADENILEMDKQFYDECAQQVIEFCKRNKIEHHIKNGTQREYNKGTEGMFKKVCNPPLTLNNY